MKLSVTTKIFLGFALLIGVFALVSMYNISKMQTLRENTTFIRSGWLPMSLEVSTLRRSVKSLENRMFADGSSRRFLRNYILAANPFLAIRQSVKRLKSRYRNAELSNAQRRLLDKLIGELAELAAREEQFQALVRKFVANTGAVKLSEPTTVSNLIGRDLRRLRSQLRAIDRRLRAQLGVSNRQAEEQERRALAAMISLTLFGILFGILILMVTQMTLRRLTILRSGVKEIARGDFTRRIRISSRDEIGQLAEDFNLMTQSLQERDRELEARQARLVQSERLAAIGTLLSQVTHEIRNPLSSIGLNTELLEEDIARLSGDKAETIALVTAIGSEVDRLTAITEQYLRFGRRPKPEKHLVKVKKLLTSLLFFLNEELTQKSIVVDASLSDVGSVLLDENQIKQALLNIIRNAADAMTDGGTLTVSIHRDANRVVIAIADTGPGIDIEQQERIFDPFFSTKDSGSGLGLPLTRQIVEEHGGQLICRSESGKGTTFEIRLAV